MSEYVLVVLGVAMVTFAAYRTFGGIISAYIQTVVTFIQAA
jgi:hypothetical protein